MLATYVCMYLMSFCKELEQKFSDTSQYKNMKKMLTSKTDTIKQLRDKLAKYVTGACSDIVFNIYSIVQV